jgi:hypothetical protein
MNASLNDIRIIFDVIDEKKESAKVSHKNIVQCLSQLCSRGEHPDF